MGVQLGHIFQNQNERKARNLSSIIFVLLLLFIGIPLIPYTFPPPEKPGVLIAFGEPDKGNADENEASAAASDPDESPSNTDQREEELVQEKGMPDSKEFIESFDDDALQLKEQEQEDGDAKLKEQEKERERLAQLEAQKKAEEEARKQAEFEAAKNQFGNLLKNKSKGETEEEGRSGEQAGDPNEGKLQEIKDGIGVIGGGLENRGVVYEPRINDSSQKSGKVVVKVCVDENGRVISANYTQKGSTTNDGDLRRIAEDAARQYRFTPFALDKQCGTITINFILK